VSLASRILTRFNTGDLRHAIKTGVAAVVCLYLADLFRLPQGYWAAVSAVIVLQSSVGATVNASLSRFADTAIGAVLGGLFVKLWGSHVWALGFAAAITVWLCLLLAIAAAFHRLAETVAAPRPAVEAPRPPPLRPGLGTEDADLRRQR
jgi:uncharacterized membrane protein YgaE (UPF0421/DUF939 family)